MAEEEIFRIINNDYPGGCNKCGLCCTWVSINSPMPDGSVFSKPSGVRCTYLTDDNMCGVWEDTEKQPEVCRKIEPRNSLCRFDLAGHPHREEAHIKYLSALENATRP